MTRGALPPCVFPLARGSLGSSMGLECTWGPVLLPFPPLNGLNMAPLRSPPQGARGSHSPYPTVNFLFLPTRAFGCLCATPLRPSPPDTHWANHTLCCTLPVRLASVLTFSHLPSDTNFWISPKRPPKSRAQHTQTARATTPHPQAPTQGTPPKTMARGEAHPSEPPPWPSPRRTRRPACRRAAGPAYAPCPPPVSSWTSR